MISVEEARRIIGSETGVLEPVEIPLNESSNRILFEAACADAFYPSGDRSMMDGYVIGAEEQAGTFRVVGEIPAGKVPERAIAAGEAMRIFTGALIPDGGGRVIMQEDVRREGDLVFVEAFGENRSIRAKGSEAKPGDAVLPKNAKLGPAEMAILAQIGVVTPRVIRKPVVRHLATGDELVGPENIPTAGEIRDTNSSLLTGLLKPFGVDLTDSRRISDDREKMTAAVEGDFDLLLISGGASVGDYDFGAEVLRNVGFTIHFDRVNLRPGKPLTFATRGKQAAFVIPGNPVSHFVCFHVAIRLVIERMCGMEPNWNFLSLDLEDAEALKPDPRETFSPVQVFVRNGKLVVRPKRWSTSGNTFSLAGTNALARVNADSPFDGKVQTLLLDLPVGEV
jgi:molybdopterin molybdotransferase